MRIAPDDAGLLYCPNILSPNINCNVYEPPVTGISVHFEIESTISSTYMYNNILRLFDTLHCAIMSPRNVLFVSEEQVFDPEGMMTAWDRICFYGNPDAPPPSVPTVFAYSRMYLSVLYTTRNFCTH